MRLAEEGQIEFGIHADLMGEMIEKALADAEDFAKLFN